MEHPIRQVYLATAIFTLLAVSSSPSFCQISTSGKFKGLPADPPEMDQHSVPWLPFEEDWNTGFFETNEWIVQQNENWRIAGQMGNVAPSAEFYYNPPAVNYQQSLTSRLLSGRNLVDGDIYLSFDLKLTSINSTGLEFLKVQVLVDSVWMTVCADSNTATFDWVTKKLNISNPAKGNNFRFRFLAEGQNSLDIYKWMIDNISVYRECAPPLNLTVELSWPYFNEVILEWEAPEGGGGGGSSAWIGWDDGTNADAIGLIDGGTFSTAVRFTTAQLAGYSGSYLTRIRFFPYAEASFVLKVWLGANAGELVYEQPVESIFTGSWNDIELETPVYVSGATELWFGYTITHDPGIHAAGIDAGPAVAGFGDMISQDGFVWESMSASYGLDYNWNIGGFIEAIDENKLNFTEKAGDIVRNKTGEKNDELEKGSATGLKNRQLLFYNVYTDGELTGTTMETSFTVPVEIGNTYCYYVTACYFDCTSGPSNEECIHLEPPKKTSIIDYFPVPANHVLTIKSDHEFSSLIITNFNYQPVYQAYHLRPGTLTINTTAFTDGIYLIRATDTEGNMITEKFIVSHY